jgi:hypothetical protein
MRTEEGVIYTTLLTNVFSHTEDESWVTAPCYRH